ncbi:hypothetical protein [Pontiella sulfatireligans]|uniref:Uncharacterized protein n=1 Tax=Pontiella sulfatireligans TaxID=2750658 RepID=A0A6C2UFN0_9BACT|nr:hypothetical protein [Pontiella sulfatireligans]VGO19022.1 hypothetical protein SCARR_01077 [Pontiella sulfatireligans]
MKSERMWKKVLKEFPCDAPADKIESTARVLEGMTYEPVLLLKTPGFLRIGRMALEKELDRVVQLTTKEMMAEGFGPNANFNEFKAKHIQLLIYHYSLLCRLRSDDPAAWDIINELYEDD